MIVLKLAEHEEAVPRQAKAQRKLVIQALLATKDIEALEGQSRKQRLKALDSLS
ncbi:hypothetical protein [Deinococcus arcticus]|uniref:hypothetical protein n=1 Tax=Deinococcus arcticus TaxID=2136176 RepID=UPI001304930B|nr:hypothetical protein [Deinococcus arcticus]